MNTKLYKEKLTSLLGKTIAVVYIFEGDDAPGYTHYEAWKADVISTWMFAIEELHGLPLIMDIRTFVQKAMNKSLPYIDFVINLNNGTTSISTLGLVPSVCSFLNIPCIPCNTVTIVTGEHKKISNAIAQNVGLNVPKTLKETDEFGITRPIGLGSSLGVKKGFDNSLPENEYLYQEFIKGFDVTTPILYNPLTDKMEILPAILYTPDIIDVNWFLSENKKALHKGYSKKSVSLSENAKRSYSDMVKAMGITTYCRIDARLHCENVSDFYHLINEPLTLDDLFFLEVNPMPTIKNEINFHTSMDALTEDDALTRCYKIYKEHISYPTHTGFILSCSILSFIAKH